MQEFIVGPDEGGQRLDKYLHRKLPLAPASFFYKMLRKKNIKLRGGKADGSERVEAGDIVTLYLSDETIGNFTASADRAELSRTIEEEDRALRRIGPLLGPEPVLYEDENILIVRKPAGVLSQKASPGDLSMNEWLRAYLREQVRAGGTGNAGPQNAASIMKGQGETGTGDVGSGSSGPDRERPAAVPDSAYRPSVCNRLDRNTGGILLCAKTLRGSRALSAVIRDRVIRKTYRMVVHGQVRQAGRIEGDLVKDRRTNLVRADRNRLTEAGDRAKPDRTAGIPQKNAGTDPGQVRRHAVTEYRPVRTGQTASIVEADLITGRSHQLRVHMASIGHPIVADPKYGDPARDRQVLKRTGRQRQRDRLAAGQLLWCAEVAFPLPAESPLMEGVLAPLAGKSFFCSPPEWWEDIL